MSQQRPNTKSIRRIVLEASLASAVIVVLQYAYWAFLFLHGDRGPGLVALVVLGLVYGVVVWLIIAAVAIWRSRHQA